MFLITLLVLSVLLIVWSTVKLKIHPFLALLLTAIIYGLCAGMPVESVVNSVSKGFGATVGGIGPVIILGVMIGVFLEHSGGAFAMAHKVITWIGKKRVSEGISLSGYIVSIPVFGDSGFMLLSPLNKAMSKEAKLSIVGTGVALSMGLLASHCMVPPTPGPVFAAKELGANLGLVIALGIIVSIIGLTPALLYAKYMGKKIYIDPEPEFSDEQLRETMRNAPGAGISFLPIIVPIVLIVIKSINTQVHFISEGLLLDIVNFFGAPVVALLVGFAFALLLPKKLEREMLSTTGWIGKAITSAGIIIMITGAGGVFGAMLRESGIANVIQELLGGAQLGIWLPFIIAAAIKSAQGSSTVAIMVTSGIVAPILGSLGITTDMEIALAVLAMGAGSCMVSHANDSFFWVVSQMTGMNVSTAYKVHTVASGIVGISSALAILVMSLILT